MTTAPDEDMSICNRLRDEFFNSSDIVFYTCASAGNYPPTFVSPNIEQLLGFKPEDFITDGDFWSSHLHPEDRERVFAALCRLEGGERAGIEYRIRNSRDAYVWVRDQPRLILEADGSTQHISGYLMNITREKEQDAALLGALRELKEKEELLRHVLDNIPQRIFWKDRTGAFLGCNRAGSDAIGLASPQDIVGKTDYDIHPNPGDADFFHKLDQGVMESGAAQYHLQLQKQRPDGKTIWLDASKIPLHDATGQVNGLLISHEDRTEYNVIEKGLRKFKLAVEQSSSAIFITDTAGIIEYVNPHFCRLYGYETQEVLGRNVRLLKSGYMPQEVYTELWDALRAGNSWHGELLNHRKDGSTIWQSASIAPILDENGRAMNFLAIEDDISGRKEMEHALVEKDEKLHDTLRQLHAILDNAQVGVAYFVNKRFVWINRRMEEMFGYKLRRLKGKTSEIFHPSHESFEAFCGNAYPILAQGKPFETEYVLKRNNGHVFWCQIRGTDVDAGDPGKGSIWILLDIDRRKNAEKSLLEINANLAQQVSAEIARGMEKERILIQQSRHAAMGEMIGNIAHQWRQPLTLLGLILQNIYADFEENLLDGESLKDYVDKAVAATRQMSSTIDDFRNFFSPNLTPTIFNVMQTVRESLSLLEGVLRNHNIAVDLHGDESLQLKGQKNDLTQVMLNLVGNAKDAFLERGRNQGEIVIRVTASEGRALIAVNDNAGGMPLEIMDKIFDPYFTTKAKGTGIGLYMVKTIVEKHLRGSIAFRNHENGAEFTVDLPL